MTTRHMQGPAVSHEHAPRARRNVGGLAVRAVLTLAGAAGMIIGGFLPWTGGLTGARLDIDLFWTTSVDRSANFITSAAFVAIVLGLVAILGLAMASGWLTRLAGALGLVGFVLFLIQRYRAEAQLPDAIGVGIWLLLIGSIVALAGGFVGGTPLAAGVASDHAHE